MKFIQLILCSAIFLTSVTAFAGEPACNASFSKEVLKVEKGIKTLDEKINSHVHLLLMQFGLETTFSDEEVLKSSLSVANRKAYEGFKIEVEDLCDFEINKNTAHYIHSSLENYLDSLQTYQDANASLQLAMKLSEECSEKEIVQKVKNINSILRSQTKLEESYRRLEEYRHKLDMITLQSDGAGEILKFVLQAQEKKIKKIGKK